MCLFPSYLLLPSQGMCQLNDRGYRNCALVNGSMTFYVTGTSNISFVKQSAHKNATAASFIQAISDLVNSGRYDKHIGRAAIRKVRLITELSAAQQQQGNVPDESVHNSAALSTTMICLIVGGCVIALVAVVTLLLICISKRANNSGMKQVSDVASSVGESSWSAGGESKCKAADGAMEILEINQEVDHAELVNDIPFDERLTGEGHRVETPFDEPVYTQLSSRTHYTAPKKITASLWQSPL
jgi:UPF0716 family protein affecting phage T7 exclusion